jgi:hypothetical protein
MVALMTKWLAYPQHLILQHILRLWFFSLVAIVTAAWLLRAYRVPVDAISKTVGGAPLKRCRKTFHTLDYASTALLVVVVCFYVFLIYYKEDFSCFDCDQLIDFPLAGHRYPPLSQNSGRFWPLGFQEFNLLRYVTRTPAGFQSVAALQLVVLVGVLFAVLKECGISWRVLIIIAVITTPGFVRSITGLIYPERNALFLLAILIMCLQRAHASRSPIYFLGCFVVTHFLLYYKEPLVVLVLVYAASQIVLDSKFDWNAVQNSWKQQLQKNIVPLGMIVVAGIYCLVFLVFMFPFPFVQSSYIQHFGGKGTLLKLLSTNLVVALLLIVCLVRVARFAFAKRQLEPLWDSLALGAVSYFFAILATGIYADYYLAPADLIAWLFLGRLAALRLSPTFKWRTATVGLAYVWLVVPSVADSTLLLLHRKQYILGASDLASFLNEYRAPGGERSVELFFPKRGGFLLAELSSYLHYKGIRVAGVDAPADSDRPEFVFAGLDDYPLGRCFLYKQYLCKRDDNPEKGALIVFLPGDAVRKSDVEEVARDSTLLVSGTSWPEDALIGRGLRLLSIASHEGYTLPQPWWQSYIFRKAR